MQISLDWSAAPKRLVVTDDDGAYGVVHHLLDARGERVDSLASAVAAVVYWGHNRLTPWRTVSLKGYLEA